MQKLADELRQDINNLKVYYVCAQFMMMHDIVYTGGNIIDFALL